MDKLFEGQPHASTTPETANDQFFDQDFAQRHLVSAHPSDS